MSLRFNTLSRFVIASLPRSNHLLVSWLQSPSTVILEPKKRKSDTVSTVSPSISHEVMGPDAMTFVFEILSFKLTFSFSSFTFIKRLFSSSLLSSIRVVSSSCCHPEFVAISSAILIPACNPSSPAYLMLCSAYTLNKQGDSREHCCTPFSILNQPIVPYSVLTVAS